MPAPTSPQRPEGGLNTERLREARKRLKWTQTQAAFHLGISQSEYALYELGQREPKTASLSALAVTFNVSADWLLGISDDQKLRR